MPKQSPENLDPKIVTQTIAELNLLAGAGREKVVATFNKIPPEERTRKIMNEIIDGVDRRIVIAIVRAWYPEASARQPNESSYERIAYKYLKAIITANPNNFFARLNGQTETMSATGEMEVLTARKIATVRERTLGGCLSLLNPRNWFTNQ